MCFGRRCAMTDFVVHGTRTGRLPPMRECAFCGAPFVKKTGPGSGRHIYCTENDCALEVIHLHGTQAYREADAAGRAAIMQAAKEKARARRR